MQERRNPLGRAVRAITGAPVSPSVEKYAETVGETPPTDEARRAVGLVDDLIHQMREGEVRYAASGDPRRYFLLTYRHTTTRIRANLAANRFLDPIWIGHLTYRFAGMYLEAERAYEAPGEAGGIAPTPGSCVQPGHCSAPWRFAFDRTLDGTAPVLGAVLLGMNAHINFDLPRAIASVIEDFDLPRGEDNAALLARRRFDHEIVNHILAETIDGAQDLLARESVVLGLADRLLGVFDEVIAELGIRHYRTQVWDHAVALALTAGPDERERACREIETVTTANAERILDLTCAPLRPFRAVRDLVTGVFG